MTRKAEKYIGIWENGYLGDKGLVIISKWHNSMSAYYYFSPGRVLIRGGSRISHYWETFAEELAAMHRADPFGFGKYGFLVEPEKPSLVHGDLWSGYRDRKDLYNLYQLLNHLNMFGRGYLPDVRRILKNYAG